MEPTSTTVTNNNLYYQSLFANIYFIHLYLYTIINTH